MREKSTLISLTGLAVIFTIALTFFTLEVPILLNRFFIDFLKIPDYNPAITPDLIEDFIVKNNLRPIGYGCLGIILILILVGFITKKTTFSTIGSIMMFLPTFGYFVSYMFFLSGLGVLRLIWMPLWGISLNVLKLGDIIYLPYMLISYILTFFSSFFNLDSNFFLYKFLHENRLTHFYMGNMHLDFRVTLVYFLIVLGTFIFIQSTIAWFYTRFKRNKVADFWLYKYSRHPQYLGWLIWSYGIMLFASLTPVVRGGANPGASLPWLISNLVVICIALNEENQMLEHNKTEYSTYREKTPFLFPLPKIITNIVTSPLRLIINKSLPETKKEVVITFLVYFILLSLMSLPFIFFKFV